MNHKERFNSARARLAESEKTLRDLKERISGARRSALQAAQRAKALPLATTHLALDDHAKEVAAYAHAATTAEGERRYWAATHEQLMRKLPDARLAVARAERELHQAHDSFWESRFNEMCKALSLKTAKQLEEIFDALTRFVDTTCPMDHFWDRVAAALSLEPRSFNDVLASTERVMPRYVRSTEISEMERSAANTPSSGASRDVLASYGAACEAATIRSMRLALRETEDLHGVATEKLAGLRSETARVELEGKKFHGEKLAPLKASIAQRIKATEADLESLSRQIEERKRDIAAAETCAAEIAAVTF